MAAKKKPTATFASGASSASFGSSSGITGTAVAPARVVGAVTLWAPETGARVTGGYSEPPQVVAERSASGAWTAVPRLKRRPLSEWGGPQPVGVEAKIRFDGAEAGRSVETDLIALRQLQDRLLGEGVPDRPPYLLVVGYMPGHYRQSQWQINGLTITEDSHQHGQCVQALATVTLAEWIDPQISVTPAKTRKAAKPYEWRKGDTLARVAKAKLGSSGEQARQKLRDANPSIKSWTKIKPGRKINIPSSTTVAK